MPNTHTPPTEQTDFDSLNDIFTWGRKQLMPWGILLVILLAFGLRVGLVDYQSLWRDEVDAIRFSDEIDQIITAENIPAELRAFLTRPGHNGPLYYIMLRIWRIPFGETEFALRYLSVLGGVLMVALIFRLARAFNFGLPVASLAALLVATSPYLIWYSQEAKMYTLLPSLVLLAAFAYRRALIAPSDTNKIPRWQMVGWWALFVVATSLSFYIHILSPLMMAVYAVWAILQIDDLKRHWRGWLAAMACLTLPYLFLLGWQLDLLRRVLSGGFESGHSFYPFPEQVSLLAHVYSSGVLRTELSRIAIGLSIFLLLLGLVAPPSLLKNIDYRRRFVFGAWLVLPNILIYVVSLQAPIFEDRYLIYLAPAFYLLMSVGLFALWRRVALAGAAVLVVFIGFNLWIGQGQTSIPIKPDFRAASTYIQSHTQTTPPTVMVQMPYLQYTFDYYYPAEYQLLEGLWTNNGRSEAEVAQEMSQRVAGVSSLWLVVSEEAMWDERRLTRQWLNENANLVDQQRFIGVEVYKYEF